LKIDFQDVLLLNVHPFKGRWDMPSSLELMYVLQEYLSALGCIQCEYCVMQDLKSGNVLLTSGGKAKIADVVSLSNDQAF
jgi:serine/threonine protein kinase